jgi:signal transduction histidine kinase
LQGIQQALTRLVAAKDFDDLCYLAVNAALDDLGVDRCGVLLYDSAKQQQLGTWGTDAQGKLRDERDMRLPLNPGLLGLPGSPEGDWAVDPHHPLMEQGHHVADGWHVQCAIFDQGELLGWIFLDNLVSLSPMSEDDLTAIRLFATVVGPMMVKFQQTLQLQKQNHFLEQTLEKLATAQHMLVEGEKMASLGRLVSGVAHELNTPLGVALTSVGEAQHSRDRIANKMEEATLTKTEFRILLAKLRDSLDLGENSLHKASKLIKHFKEIAAWDNDNVIKQVNLSEVITAIAEDAHVTFAAPGHSLEMSLSDDLPSWPLPLSSFTQVISHLMNNAYSHGLAHRDHGVVKLRAVLSEQNHQPGISISVSDDGCGMNDELLKHIFDPFFTTDRQQGVGLGSSIVYNLVVHQMRGKITASRNDEGGLCVEFWLPEQRFLKPNH